MTGNRLVTYESRDGIALITINRPEKRNAIDSETGDQLADAWERLRSSGDRAAVLTGAGDAAFCSGADLASMPEIWRILPNAGVPVDKPLIAAVSGWAIGLGAILVQMSDLCIATESARLWYPEPMLGTTAAFVASLSVRIPHKVAMEFMLLCEPMSADRAYQVGLVNEVVPDGQHVARAINRANRIAEHGSLALGLIKQYVGECLPKGPSERAALVEWQLEQVRASSERQEMQLAYTKRRSAPRDGAGTAKSEGS